MLHNQSEKSLVMRSSNTDKSSRLLRLSSSSRSDEQATHQSNSRSDQSWVSHMSAVFFGDFGVLCPDVLEHASVGLTY